MESRSVQEAVYKPWQEGVIERFEALVDDNRFTLLLNQYTVQDVTRASFTELEIPALAMPATISETHYFPGRFKMSNFEATLTRLPADNSTELPSDSFWQLTAHYSVNDTPYTLSADSEGTLITTTNYDGGELKYSYGPELAGRMLTAIAASKLAIEEEKLADYVDEELFASDTLLESALLVIGSRDGYHIRDRLISLPWLDEDRAVVLTYSEMESPGTSGRKLDYVMSWQLSNQQSTHSAVTQQEFVGRRGLPQFFAERAPTDTPPDQLLFDMQFGGSDGPIGQFFDPDLNRDRYAEVITAILPVVEDYLDRSSEKSAVLR